MQENPTVTAAEIARLAGVGRAAVSNWRKRHADFPTPLRGAPASPEFDLLQVERWLRAQGKLPGLSPVDRLWRRLAAGDSPSAALVAAGTLLLARHRGEHPEPGQVAPYLAPVGPEIGALVDELGPRASFDELWQRFATPGPGRSWATPDDVADLMVALTGVDGGTVLDPACGSGATLRAAVRAGCTEAYGQELDGSLARLAGLWLALRDVPGEVLPGDSLRADAFTDRTVDAVVCHPPFGSSGWGHEDLDPTDPRWDHGLPPRTEPELAWVGHALAHLRSGGHAVLLMPPAVASRRPGRRIRAALLRTGALRAVVALPAGVAAPYGVPLHLWVLRRPAGDEPLPARTLLVDATDGEPTETYPKVLDAFRAFSAGPDAEVGEAGFARAVPVIELLDDNVDLTPARRQPAADDAACTAHLVRTAERLAALVGDLPALVPTVTVEPDVGTAPRTVTVTELVRAGAVRLFSPVRGDGAPTAGDDGSPVLTVADVVGATDASGRDVERLGRRIPLRAGDVVVPLVSPRLTARVVTVEGTVLGRNLYLLRPDPTVLDPWFLAGQLRTSANEKQTGSLSGTLRFDIRRARVRRLPLDEQRVQGAAYQRLDAFEAAIRQVAGLGEELIRLTADGLARGTVRPDQPAG
ncbi:N-6 DNA methylase [Plantactinospora sonchi]|uniref:N-6 DNA methylase n=1 Tax=Plantactinospora sonchi TaxID=1544735 RepID=A0ABU7RZ79_9ACTN